MERRTIRGARAAMRTGCDVRGVLRTEHGVSMVETVVVLAIAGIVLAASSPRAADLLDTIELRSASIRFAAALARGRAAALSEGRSWRLRLDGTTRFVLAPLDDVTAAAEPLPPHVFFASATSGGDVRFFSSGMVDNATFTLGVGDARRRVIVNQRGRVTIE
jgi:prepilin-type N-terminal cleavage/methylation domain-containing protein